MSSRERIVLGMIVVLLMQTAGFAAEAGKTHAARTAAKPPAEYPGAGKTLSARIDQTFTQHRNDQDILRAFITKTQEVSGQYTAYVYVCWGDLENKIAKCAKEHYQNWDGKVTVSSGNLSVDRKIAFDDGSRAKTGAKATAKAGKNVGPHEGSGRDELVTDSGKEVVWKAGVVGALDGLVIKVTTTTPNATVTVHAGPYTHTFQLKP